MMNIILSISQILFMAFVLLVPAQASFAGHDDHVEARRLLDAGEILPLESILKKVRERLPGTVLEVKLETEDDVIVYELELLGNDGVVREIYINAKTGDILSSKEDD
jgi:uncharacterized membrane protein YkoI